VYFQILDVPTMYKFDIHSTEIACINVFNTISPPLKLIKELAQTFQLVILRISAIFQKGLKPQNCQLYKVANIFYPTFVV
jgi:hypothetical protein